MTEFEYIFLGFIFGFLMAMFCLWVGVFAGDKGIKKEPEKKEEKKPSQEEVLNVLENLRIGASQSERKVLDFIMGTIEERSEDDRRSDKENAK